MQARPPRARNPQSGRRAQLTTAPSSKTAAARSSRDWRSASASGVTGLLLGIAHWESFASRKASQAAARIFGGEATDHVTFGRMAAFGSSALVLTATASKLVNILTTAGEQTEVAHAEAPQIPEVTGSPASTVPWSVQSREGRRWLGSVLTVKEIEDVIQEAAKQPIRAYASLQSGTTDEERAAVVMRELERTNAFERSAIALFSPTGSGYVNYVASETFEYLTRGDCASFAIEYSVLPSSFSLQAVPLGTRQTRLVVDAVVERLLSMKPEDRPKFYMFGEPGDRRSARACSPMKVPGVRAASA